MNTLNIDLLRSRVDIFILKALSITDRYGYEIMELLYKESCSHYEIKQSTLYNILNRLENNNFLFSYEGIETNGAKRKYYSLTDKGKEKLRKEQKEWEFTRSLLDKLVSDKEIDLTSTPSILPTKNIKPLTLRKRSEKDLETKETSSIKDSSNFKVIDSSSTEPLSKIKETLKEEHVTQIEKGHVEANYRNNFDQIFSLDSNAPYNFNYQKTDSPKRSDSKSYMMFESEQSTVEKQKYKNLGDLNYKDILSDIYDQTKELPSSEYSNEEEIVITNSIHYNDLVQKLKNENIITRTYKKSNLLYYDKKYFFSSQSIKDSYLILSVILLIELVFLFIFNKDNLSVNLIVTCLFSLIPGIAILYWRHNPNKKIRTNKKYSTLILSFSLILFVLVIIIAVTSIFFGIKKQLYLFFFFLNIPLYFFIVIAKFKTKKYHLGEK